CSRPLKPLTTPIRPPTATDATFRVTRCSQIAGELLADGLLEELHEVRPRGGGSVPLPSRDVRARRPPLFGSILRLDLARRLTRIVTLAVLDAAGIYLALLTALELKLVVRGDSDIAAA